MPRQRNAIRDFPGKRWLNVVLRTAHIGGIVLLGAGLLGAGEMAAGGLLTLLSGLGMFAIDLWANPAHLRETAGFGVLAKLALVGLILLMPGFAPVLFWAILVISTLLSHAPGGLRHRQLF
jgi:hypothetical protein